MPAASLLHPKGKAVGWPVQTNKSYGRVRTMLRKCALETGANFLYVDSQQRKRNFT